MATRMMDADTSDVGAHSGDRQCKDNFYVDACLLEVKIYVFHQHITLYAYVT
jgi:hypothetical protein